jgi:chromosome segregation ATPase
LLMDCRTELRNERKERRDDREDAEAEIETLREILSIREGQLEYCRKDAERMQKEIEILQESCRRREDRASEASHQASVLANVCADQKREIERLKKYADALHEDKMNALLEVHKIREALNGVLFAEKS